MPPNLATMSPEMVKLQGESLMHENSTKKNNTKLHKTTQIQSILG